MSSIESIEPLGFFSLPRELRDEIYDILHKLQDGVEFGIDRELVAHFPLPHLHRISRRFTAECESRAPSRPLLIVTQKLGDIQTFKGVYVQEHRRSRCTADCDHYPRRMERIELSKIVNLRHMQNHHFVERLQINFYTYDATNGAAKTERPALRISMHNRLKWINEFVQNACSPEVGLKVRIRFMLNDIKDIHTVRGFRNTPWLMRPHCTLEVVVDCPSEQECQEEEFSRAKTLAVANFESIWCQCFNYQEIERCEALAELRSGRRTAAASPQSREGEAVGEYQEVGAREETSTSEGLGEHEASPANSSTMCIARLS